MSKLAELAKQYREIEAKHEAAKTTLAELAAKWTEIENKIMEAFVEEGVNSAKLEGLGHFILVTKNFFSVTIANKEQYFDYLKKSGNDSILKLDVNVRTNAAFLDRHFEELVLSYENTGLNKLEAREKALQLLQAKGVSYLTEKGIRVRKL